MARLVWLGVVTCDDCEMDAVWKLETYTGRVVGHFCEAHAHPALLRMRQWGTETVEAGGEGAEDLDAGGVLCKVGRVKP